MSDYTAHEFIAGFLDGYFFDAEEGERAEQAVHHLLAAMKDDFAVVKLPKPVGVNGEDNAVWLHSPYIEQSFSGEVVISDRLAIAVDELRTVAAALLAAADAAEQVTA